MLSAIRRLIQRYGFFKRDYLPCPANPDWHSADFFTEHRRKNERLAAIARERDALKDALDKAIKQKKKRSGFYLQIRALKNAEMAVEQGKPEPGK